MIYRYVQWCHRIYIYTQRERERERERVENLWSVSCVFKPGGLAAYTSIPPFLFTLSLLFLFRFYFLSPLSFFRLFQALCTSSKSSFKKLLLIK